MPSTLTNPRHATPRKRLADVCFKPAHAGFAPTTADPIYDCIEAVQRAFGLTEQEMSYALGIAQSNYTRRSYNAARVQRLPIEQRELFIDYFAQAAGLKVNRVTPHEQVKNAAKLAIVNLLELLESAS